MTIEQLYEEVSRRLPVGERLRLASPIMWECAGAGKLDCNEEWTADDLRELTAAGWDLIERRLREEDEGDQ